MLLRVFALVAFAGRHDPLQANARTGLDAIPLGNIFAHGDDRSLTDLVGQLSTRSEAFRSRWAAHDVKLHRSGVKKVHHPVVGNLEVDYEALILAADVNLRMNVYTAAPDTPTHAALRLLASWAASERTASR